MDPKIFPVEKKIGYVFKNKDLLIQALTHSSYSYEKQQKPLKSNEVLEFLGDSVVGLIVADFFSSAYPDFTEGELSKLKSTTASTSALADLAKKIKLDKSILLGKGEEKSGGRKKKTILAGVFEAVLGALYLDGGFSEAKRFLLPHLKSASKEIGEGHFFINNYKSALQEYFQKESLPPPVYKMVTSKGPEHEKEFIVEVYLNDRPLAKAKGPSKKSAEQKAAQKAFKKLLGRNIKSLTPETFILKKK